MNSAIPVPRGSTITIRSRQLNVRRPIPTTPLSAIAAPITRIASTRHLAIWVEVIRAAEIDGVNFDARDEHLQVDDFGAPQVERLQLVRCECDVLAALILVSPDDLFLDLLAGARIVRPERNPSCGATSFSLIFDIIRTRSRRRSLGDTSPTSPAEVARQT